MINNMLTFGSDLRKENQIYEICVDDSQRNIKQVLLASRSQKKWLLKMLHPLWLKQINFSLYS